MPESEIRKAYEDYAMDLYREHPQQFKQARAWINKHYPRQLKLRF